MKTKIDSKNFRVKPGNKINLNKWPTRMKPVYKSKKDYLQFLQQHIAELSARQNPGRAW
jgi:hypothetical protein